MEDKKRIWFYDEEYKKIYSKISFRDSLCDLGDLMRIGIIEDYIGDKYFRMSLDAGCGGGLFLPLLSRHSKNVVGVDISKIALNFAKDRNKYLWINNVELRNMFLKDINKLKSKFDLIICMEVLEHCDSDKEILSLFFKNLSKNGSLILSIPNSQSFFLSPNNFFKRGNFGHINKYNKQSIIELLRSLNFKVKTIVSYKVFFLPWIEKLNKKLYLKFKGNKFYLRFILKFFIIISKLDLMIFKNSKHSEGFSIICEK